MIRKRIEKAVYWGAFILDGFEHLQDNELTSSDFKILFFLCQKMTPRENMAFLKQKQIAEELNMDKGNVSKCIKRLCEKQFIAKAKNGFMINPHLFYVGKRFREEREKLRDVFDELLQDSGVEQRFYLNEDDYQLEEYTD